MTYKSFQLFRSYLISIYDDRIHYYIPLRIQDRYRLQSCIFMYQCVDNPLSSFVHVTSRIFLVIRTQFMYSRLKKNPRRNIGIGISGRKNWNCTRRWSWQSHCVRTGRKRFYGTEKLANRTRQLLYQLSEKNGPRGSVLPAYVRYIHARRRRGRYTPRYINLRRV